MIKAILASEYLGRDVDAQVCVSAVGYYIGYRNHEGPISRESEEYFATFEGADRALKAGQWTQRQQA
jgi:hypothetical protein